MNSQEVEKDYDRVRPPLKRRLATGKFSPAGGTSFLSVSKDVKGMRRPNCHRPVHSCQRVDTKTLHATTEIGRIQWTLKLRYNSGQRCRMERIGTVLKTTFTISKMDCPSEERMVRMKLEAEANVRSLEFDISARRLDVYHTDGYEDIFSALDSLRLDTKLVSSGPVEVPVSQRRKPGGNAGPSAGASHQSLFLRPRDGHGLFGRLHGARRR